jgi:hypothetical protein
LLKCRRGKQTIHNGQCHSFTLGLNHKPPPTIRDSRINRQDAASEAGLQIHFQPCFKHRALFALGKSCHSLPDFTESHHTEVELTLFRGAANPKRADLV